MKRNVLAAVMTLVALGAIATGCLDRQPAPVCPVPIEIAQNEVTAAEFDGVDMIVVVDNSASMTQEQAILSAGFFTLINSLTTPIQTWAYAPVKNMHVAVVTCNLGVMYGPTHDTTLSPTNTRTCEDVNGDDGQFKTIDPLVAATITIPGGVISCDAATGAQCPPTDPTAWTCTNPDANNVGTCEPQGGNGLVNCNTFNGTFALTQGGNNLDLTRQVACMGQQGTGGCGFEQQLESAVRGLEVNQSDFIVPSHLLAVLEVSDEEDCSINDPALFNTPEWLGSPDAYKELVNVACNWHNEQMDNQYLFAAQRYRDMFIGFKDQQANAVIFAAIVGVPQNDVCQGTGDAITGCLADQAMQYSPQQFHDEVNDVDYTHFAPACTRNGTDGLPITEARPGRRFVEVANLFGANGYVYSICNQDWSPAMEQIAAIIAKQISSSCYAKQLNWQLLPKEKQPAQCTEGNCGVAECDVVVEYTLEINDPDKCPPELYAALSPADKAAYEAKVTSVKIEGSNGQVTQKKLYCPLPKLATPKACATARDIWPTDTTIGWFYCEEEGENFLSACKDGKDNDANGLIDEADTVGCAACYDAEEANTACDDKKCSYGVEITEAGKDVSGGNKITVQCLQQFTFEDQNCQEDSPSTCYDSNDEIDEDGNGIRNCTSGDGVKSAHDPDPNCCPMEADKNNVCVVDTARVVENCKNGMAKWMPPEGVNKDLQPNQWSTVPACAAHVKLIGCTPPAK